MTSTLSLPAPSPTSSVPGTTNEEHKTSFNLTRAASSVRPYSQSYIPAGALSTLMFGSCLVRGPALPSPSVRFGFGAAFGLAAFALNQGDKENGAGIATAWSLIYLFVNARSAFRSPRHPVGLAMTGASALSSVLYGTEYFVLQE